MTPLSTPAPDATVADLELALQVVRQSVVDLLSTVPERPAELRVTAGPARVEMSWDSRGPSPGASPAVPAPAMVPAPPVPGLAVVPGLPAEAGAERAVHICAPSVGVFYRAPEPGAAPFVDTGDTISAGQQVGIVEVMKMMIPVQTDHSGRVLEILATDGGPVEFGQPLFAVAAG